jgi:hypothetical protein
MNNNPILPKVIPCKNHTINSPVINCVHWDTDQECNTSCSIDVIKNPDFNFCVKCDKRKSLESSHAEPSRLVNENIIVSEIKKDIDLKIKKLRDKAQEGIKKGAELKKQMKSEKSFIEKASSYLKAESSQATQGKISKENFEKRKEICMNCEFRVNNIPLPNKQPNHDSIGWCKGGCGCSVGNPRAALSEKLYMPTLRCPKGKFEEEKGEGFKVSDTLDSAKGIIKSVKSLFTKE